MRNDTFILLATQKKASDDDPATDAIYQVGTLASVLQLLKLPDGTVKVLAEDTQRVKVLKYTNCSEHYESEAGRARRNDGRARRAEAYARSVTSEFELLEAQQEGVARGDRRRPADRELCQPRRHHRLAAGEITLRGHVWPI